MQTIRHKTEALLSVKNSRFESLLYPVSSREDAEKLIETIKHSRPKANHHCYAMRLNPLEPFEFAQDDGEPSGTAGQPILQRLQSAALFDVILFVVRTFGGVKLGRSGLIRAYGDAAQAALETVKPVALMRYKHFSILYPYSEESLIQSILHTYPVIIRDSQYREDVRLEVLCPVTYAGAFSSKVQSARHLIFRFDEGRDCIAPAISN